MRRNSVASRRVSGGEGEAESRPRRDASEKPSPPVRARDLSQGSFCGGRPLARLVFTTQEGRTRGWEEVPRV